MRPTIRQLEYLIALAEEKSFLGAADRCNVTQSTLSAGIKELESILDTPLVTRGRKNITLTPFGEETLATARNIVTQADNITTRAQQIKAPMSGIIRMGVIPTIAPYFLPMILPRIKEEFPKLELQLHEDLSHRIIEKLSQNQLDITLMAFPFDTPHMTQTILFEEPFYLACPAEYTPPQTPVNTTDLNAGELLLLEDGHCLRDHALSACDLQPPKHRKAYSATGLQTLIQMVSNGYGMTLLPDMAAQEHLLPRNITIHPFDNPKPTRQIGLCWRKNHPREEEFQTLGKSMLNT